MNLAKSNSNRFKSMNLKFLICLISVLIIVGYLVIGNKDYSLCSVAVSSDGGLVAYCSSGYTVPQVLYLAKNNGTIVFEHKFNSKETAGGTVVLFFEEDTLCAYSFRTHKIMSFSKEGEIINTTENDEFKYPDEMQGFKTGFSTKYLETSAGRYEYKNWDFISSFVFKKSRVLTFTDSDNKEYIIWEGE